VIAGVDETRGEILAEPIDEEDFEEEGDEEPLRVDRGAPPRLDPALADLQLLGRTGRRSLGGAFGFHTNEAFFFWVETLARLGLFLDLAGFRAAAIRQGEQCRVLFDPGRDYVLKLLYKEHREKLPGAAFTSFELAHRLLGDFVPPLLLGCFRAGPEDEGCGAAALKVTRTVSRRKVRRRGKRLVDALVSTLRHLWRRGIFDGDLPGLASNRPGIAADGSLLLLDFGALEDTRQDRLYEVHGALGDDPFHMAIDKLHATRDELERIEPRLARRFEGKLGRAFGLQLRPPGAWKRGRKGSRGEAASIPLAESLRAAVKACRPRQGPSDHYALPWIGGTANQLVAAAVRRRAAQRGAPAASQSPVPEDRMAALFAAFPAAADPLRRLTAPTAHRAVGLEAVWHAHRVSDLAESLHLLSEPRLASLFDLGLELLDGSSAVSPETLRASLLDDLNRTVLGVLALAASPRAAAALEEIAREEVLGSETTDRAFRQSPIRLYQALERIAGRWGDPLSASGEGSLGSRLALLAAFGGDGGDAAVRAGFVHDSLALTRILMALGDDHNLRRSVDALEPLVGADVLRRLHREDVLAFFEALDVPLETRRDVATQWQALCGLGLDPEALRTAFVTQPRFFMGTVPFLGAAWLRAMTPGDLSNPGALDVAGFVRDHGARLVFVNSNVAGLRSTRGVVHACRLPPDVYVVGLRNQLRDEVELVRRHFPRQELTTDIGPAPGRIVLRWVNKVRAPIRRLPHAPFKSVLPPRISTAERRGRREALGLGSRPLVVVCSPLTGEVEVVADALVRLRHRGDQLPLTVLGMREPEHRLAGDLRRRGLRAEARDWAEAPWDDAGGRDVVVLNTIGELLGLLAAADLAIVGMDRNLFEPASQGLPILYFDGPWTNNQTELRLLVAHGAARAVEPYRLEAQIAEALARRGATLAALERARQALERKVLPSATLLASLAITHLVAEDAERRGHSGASPEYESPVRSAN
jgi:hypothetical protein